MNSGGAVQLNLKYEHKQLSEENAFLREKDLAHRWQTSQRTLQRWRKEGYGPGWMTIGGSVRYRLRDILEFEAIQFHEGSAE